MGGRELKNGRGKGLKGIEDGEGMRLFGLLLMYSLLPLLCNSALCAGHHISCFMYYVTHLYQCQYSQ